ncbi:MAG: DUF6929 family protein [Candidatus Nanopelagicales bacterium]
MHNEPDAPAVASPADFTAQIVSARPLTYLEGPDVRADRPPFARAASGMAWVGERLAVIQDDANFVALVAPTTGVTRAVALPRGPGDKRLFDQTRGTKHLKHDFEACFVQPFGAGHELIAFGSGTESPRERILSVLFDAAGEVTAVNVLAAGPFYEHLRARTDFSGSELNLEGAVLRGERVLLFQRGNGAPTPDRAAVNAIGEVDLADLTAYLGGSGPIPQLVEARRYDLGCIGAVPYTFTDATLAPSGAIRFVGSAEDSENAVLDGQLLGTIIGEITASGDVRSVVLTGRSGAPTRAKAEGIAGDPDDPTRLWLVVDPDDPARPSELLEVRLT